MPSRVFKIDLFSLALSNDLNTLVVAACLANAICTVVLAALRALNDVGGVFELPNAGASLHLSRVRNFSLWYCHCKPPT